MNDATEPEGLLIVHAWRKLRAGCTEAGRSPGPISPRAEGGIK
jgi:hypothetical protein